MDNCITRLRKLRFAVKSPCCETDLSTENINIETNINDESNIRHQVEDGEIPTDIRAIVFRKDSTIDKTDTEKE